MVLFPDGKVTPRQERQFSTLGGNVTAVAVQGDFDDCQRMAKEAFQEQARLGRRTLTSANSINVGRFLPQTTYFFEVWARFQARSENRTQILFSVPSGNFGNLAAGLLAKAMGLSDVSFLAATNMNDGVVEFLRTGRFLPRPSTPTLSTAMDVGDPSNLDRITHLYGGSLDGLREDLVGHRVTDAETMSCIRRIHQETGLHPGPPLRGGIRCPGKGVGEPAGGHGRPPRHGPSGQVRRGRGTGHRRRHSRFLRSLPGACRGSAE